jgi:hypothetical protein
MSRLRPVGKERLVKEIMGMPRVMCLAFALLAAAPASAERGRFELVPEPGVRQNASNSITSAYVVDKKSSQFWLCTVRYHYQDLTANNGDCVELATDIGRPSLTEAYQLHAVNGTPSISAVLPVFWFIDPQSGAVQFCAIRHAGICVQMTLP